MSSGTPQTPGFAAGHMAALVKNMSPEMSRRMQSLGMSPRQQELNWLWGWYTAQEYEVRAVDWDGAEHLDRLSYEAVARGGTLPGGFYYAEDLPLKFRRPPAPYRLPRVIVNRFSGLLFSESQHPQITVPGDPATEKYLNALAAATSLWAEFYQVRTFGGAQGTAVVAFKFIEGKPMIEVLDPRWITPRWKNRETFELAAFEKRYKYPEFVLDDDGNWEQVDYWFRRIVDETHDVVWSRVPVGDGAEPKWEDIKPDQFVEHNLGDCPAVWIQNKPVSDDIDGEPDCLGVFDMVEEADALIGQASRGTKANSDPTLHIASDEKLGELRKGSANAIKTKANGSVAYVELAGTGPKTAWDLAREMRGMILEVAQCVLEDPDKSGAKTATEVERDYSSMTSNCDILREQYGNKGVVRVLTKMLRAIRTLADANMSVSLPPEIKANPDKPDQPPQVIERVLPKDIRATIELVWPPYFRPSVQDGAAAATGVAQARQAEALPLEAAIRYLKQHGFPVGDVAVVLKALKKEKAERDQAIAQSMGQMGGGAMPAVSASGDELPITPSDFATLITVNEARASRGMPPLKGDDGDLTIPEFKAKHAAVLNAAAKGEAGELGG